MASIQYAWYVCMYQSAIRASSFLSLLLLVVQSHLSDYGVCTSRIGSYAIVQVNFFILVHHETQTRVLLVQIKIYKAQICMCM